VRTRTLYFESLGCPKNRVDTEVMLAALLGDGWRMVDDPAAADLIVLNTCAFIEDARKESLDRVFDLHAHRRKDSRLVLAGCLPQLYPDIAAKIPEADLVIGIEDIPHIAALVGDGDPSPQITTDPHFIATARHDRALTLSPYTSYIKIADGCDNRCSYCAIPLIRGAYRERPPRDILDEAQRLIDTGVKELTLIAQDTTAYGRDHDTTLAKLLVKLAKLPGEFRIRVMYLYPSGIDEALLDAFDNPKIIPYFEIPLQHADDTVLKAMRRRYRRRDIDRALNRIIQRFGDRAVIRTTFIAGFPGETAAQFEEMRRFIAGAPLDYIGAFGYSKEENTPAGKLRSHRRDTIAKRLALLQETAQATMEQRLARLVGTTTTVLYEEFDPESALATGRGKHQAPEIDGITILTNLEKERPGDLLTVRLTGRDGIDFTAEVVR